MHTPGFGIANMGGDPETIDSATAFNEITNVTSDYDYDYEPELTINTLDNFEFKSWDYWGAATWENETIISTYLDDMSEGFSMDLEEGTHDIDMFSKADAEDQEGEEFFEELNEDRLYTVSPPITEEFEWFVLDTEDIMLDLELSVALINDLGLKKVKREDDWLINYWDSIKRFQKKIKRKWVYLYWINLLKTENWRKIGL